MNYALSDLNPRDGFNNWTENHIGLSYQYTMETEQMTAHLLAEIRTNREERWKPTKKEWKAI
jgi:hypothetical protein